MSTTTPTGQHHLADVASYAAAVRRHLVGLSAEQVDDLTDGLEADLADALADPLGSPLGSPTASADGADLTARFGSPATYAQELRAAAGLPDAGPPVERHRVRGLLAAPFRTVAGAARSALDRLRERPWWPPVEEFLVTLAPAAWLLRGWLVAKVVSAVLRALVPDGGAGGAWLPTTFLDWLLLIGLCVVSVQWGRGRWQDGRWSRRARRAATLVAVVAALPVFVAVAEHDARPSGVRVEYQTVYTPEVPQDGVVVGGMAVSNLFAYDAAGNPIEGVQIFDDRGRPVRTTADEGRGDWSLPGVADPWAFVSAQDVDGRQLWNVYPLLGGPSRRSSGTTSSVSASCRAASRRGPRRARSPRRPRSRSRVPPRPARLPARQRSRLPARRPARRSARRTARPQQCPTRRRLPRRARHDPEMWVDAPTLTPC
ncbi:hypothetical protein DDP54_11500 [Cellulomonas sp. WB94]|uniref:HAAS signaling domain-containing protein n=1 Tax=Cellulomonas sp. WB94 TaxID=2173174 RepID=UPI000D56D66D|nr:hypothetical protein [Cellulomonas sp. WB94]PVU83517.1 hypothetical protein DDP54_11500 [Cellulomonas sp. WB94]